MEAVKVGVFASGEFQLEGQTATLTAIEERLKQAAQEGAAVLYYRENAGGEPPADMVTQSSQE